jgi:hypothetical protein
MYSFISVLVCVFLSFHAFLNGFLSVFISFHLFILSPSILLSLPLSLSLFLSVILSFHLFTLSPSIFLSLPLSLPFCPPPSIFSLSLYLSNEISNLVLSSIRTCSFSLSLHFLLYTKRVILIE